MSGNNIVVLTPTYNRAKTLPRLYESLIRQTNKNFTWLIVDDGSSDDTKFIVNKVMNEKKLNIKYVYQNNGGKARALNKGFSYCMESQLVMVVDSDDYLLPTAIATAYKYLSKYKDDNSVGGLFFHYKTPDGNILKPKGKVIKSDKVMTPYQYYRNFGKHDGCHCYLNKVIKRYRYPEFSGEKYVGPSVLQLEMADNYKIVYSPKIVGVAEYQEDGLTNSGRRLRLNNPMGMIYYSMLMMDRKSDLFTQLKYSISIWPYAKIAGKSIKSIITMINRPFILLLTYIPGQILYLYWKKKYL